MMALSLESPCCAKSEYNKMLTNFTLSLQKLSDLILTVYADYSIRFFTHKRKFKIYRNKVIDVREITKSKINIFF